MKKTKKILLASLLIATGYSTLASAHTQSGSVGISLTGAAATDVYVVSCPSPGVRLAVHVKDLAPVYAPLVSIQATKGTASSVLSTDAVDGDAAYSTLVALAAGSGSYTLKVNKSASTVKVAELYTAEFHCKDSAGNHTDTTWVMTQNQ